MDGEVCPPVSNVDAVHTLWMLAEQAIKEGEEPNIGTSTSIDTGIDGGVGCTGRVTDLDIGMRQIPIKWDMDVSPLVPPESRGTHPGGGERTA